MSRFRLVLLLCFVVVHVTSGYGDLPAEIPPPLAPHPSECRDLMDLYFVLDGSDSISYPDFGYLKQAMASLVPQIRLGENQARIGMLVYSSGVPADSEHSFSADMNYLLHAATTLSHPRDGTNTALGIRHMRSQFGKYGRPTVPWVAVVITDGISKNFQETAMEAQLARDMGISMFAVGVTNKINITELMAIADTPKQVIELTAFNELQGRLAKMMKTICPCPTPPVYPLAECSNGPLAIGSVRTYICKPGYFQRGNADIFCRDDSTWSPLDPSFECVPCGAIPVISHAYCDGQDNLIGSKRLYGCETGYALLGDPQIECLPDATWSVPKFTCSPCGDTPVVPMAMCNGGGNLIGNRRQYSCDPRYALIGDPSIECLPNAQWSLPQFTCSLCGDTPNVLHGMCGGGDHFVDTVRHYQCEKGYALIGDPTIRCMPNGYWSQPQLTCSLCGDTPAILHSSCGGGEYFVESVRQYTCDRGYALLGDPHITCLPTGQWSIPQFTCSLCGNTPVIEHGSCGGGEHFVDSVRQYQCDPGYALIGDPYIRCLPNAQWSSVQFSCSLCGDTPVIQHGSCGGGDHFVDSVRQYQCNTGFALIGDPYIKCLPNGQWSPVQISCSLCGNTPVVEHGSCGGGDHFVDSVRQYQCDAGYALIGDPYIRCLPNAQWSDVQVRCSLCGDTPVIQHGSCGGGDHFVDSVRQYQCDPGFALIGDPYIKCLPNGQWSPVQISCSLCGNTPVVEHGSCGGGDHFVDSVRQYQCDAGYALIGDPYIRCLPNAQWSDVQVRCSLCGDTPVIQHGSCGGGDHFVDSLRQYQCDPGYALIGDPYIRCLPNGQWSPVQISCSLCGNTPVVQHGSCGGGDHFVDSVRQYQCDAGYALIGDPYIQCLPTGHWSDVKFSCSLCGETPVIEHGSCGGGDHFVDSVRQYHCDRGYALIGDPNIRCLPNGQWSDIQFSCSLCGGTPVIEHGICGGGDHFVDSVRQYQCERGYALIGDPSIRCLPNGQWSVPQLTCSLCGDTPIVEHGRCGGGDHFVDSVRQYECDIGYAMVGDPDIRCLPNGQWSVVHVSCIRSCGATPHIDYGTCTGVDHIVDSVRQYVCEIGYAMIGDPMIRCLPDGRWSEVRVSCRPCGDTPRIPDAVCGAGGYLVGDRRTYHCKDGFQAVGGIEIECLPDGTWSQINLECKVLECGVPPPVLYAYPGLGSNSIGAYREYYCDVGYKMRGYGRITCLSNGQWESPQFSCEIVTTPRPTTPAPVPTDPSVCDACRLVNGVGYNRHPYDCSQYVQCYFGLSGIESVYRRCPFGLFWDQDVLTCRESYLVHCPTDRCRNKGIFGYKTETDPSNCCSYWKCDNGVSRADCCGKGMTFNPQTGQCEYDDQCQSPCLYQEIMPGCDKRPTYDETKFEQHIGMGHWLEMPCAPGTAFNPVDCQCSLTLMTIPGKVRQVCKPSVYLPFHTDHRDKSGQSVYVENHNVTIFEGAAYFDGNARLMIPRFTNQQFAGHLVIKFRYREDVDAYSYDQIQALVSNGDCGSDPSIIISKIPEYVIMAAKTRKLRTLAVPTINKVWKEVVFMHDESYLEGSVCGASAYTSSAGPIQATHCSLQIGYGQGLHRYKGYIDDFTIYQCRPRRLSTVVY